MTTVKRRTLTPRELAEVEDLVLDLWPDANLSRGEKTLLAEGLSMRWNIIAVKRAVKEQRRRQGKGTGAYAKPDIGAICRMAKENEDHADSTRAVTPGEMTDGDEIARYYDRELKRSVELYGPRFDASRMAWQMHAHLVRAFGRGEKQVEYREHLIGMVFGHEVAEDLAYYERDYGGYMLDAARRQRERAEVIATAKKPDGESPSKWAHDERFRKETVRRLRASADIFESGLRAVIDREQGRRIDGASAAVGAVAGLLEGDAGG